MEKTSGPEQQTARQEAEAPRQRQAVPEAELTLMGPQEAYSRMEGDHPAELRAYVLGFQAVIWGMQWVKGGRALRMASAPLRSQAGRSPVDPRAHGVNVWGHAHAVLTDKMRLIETPNTETLYSVAVVDLVDGPVVVLHPELGERYFRTSIWELHGDTHTISQKRDGGHPPPYALLPLGWAGELPAGMKSIRVRSRYVLISAHVAVYGENDVRNVTALQDGFALINLRGWGSSNRPLEPGRPMRPLHRPNTSTPPELLCFEELCETLKDLTIRDDEAGFARQLEEIGITLKDGFQPDRLDSPRWRA